MASYKPINNREAEDIVEKVIPRLQHANASVVLAAVKVFFIGILVIFIGYSSLL